MNNIAIPSIVNRHLIKQFMLAEALKQSKISGYNLEFGVAHGYSINYLATRSPDKIFYGFDCWKGIPEDWYTIDNRLIAKKGTYSRDGIIPIVKPNIQLVSGLFEISLPVWTTQNTDVVSMMHIDCDLYSSTKTIFKYFNDQIVAGTIILFDEWLQPDNKQKNGEAIAFLEWLDQSNRTMTELQSIDNKLLIIMN